MPARGAAADGDWMSLSEACRQLGVSASTLRRWADSGEVAGFVTPGGHRRLSRSSILAMLPRAARERPALSGLGRTHGRIVRVYRRVARDPERPIPWVAELDPADRERFRGHGRAIIGALLAAIEAREPERREEHLAVARAACTDYGATAGATGVSVATTTAVFLRYRRPFMAELATLARRRGLDADATAALIDDASDAIDDLLVGTLRGWEAGLGQARPLRRPGTRGRGARPS